MKLVSQDLLNLVRSMMKIKPNNNMINRTSAVYARNDIELLGPITRCVVIYKN